MEKKQPPIMINNQYIKDLSMEIPHAPHIFKKLNENAPKIDIEVNIETTKLEEGLPYSHYHRLHNWSLTCPDFWQCSCNTCPDRRCWAVKCCHRIPPTSFPQRGWSNWRFQSVFVLPYRQGVDHSCP